MKEYSFEDESDSGLWEALERAISLGFDEDEKEIGKILSDRGYDLNRFYYDSMKFPA